MSKFIAAAAALLSLSVVPALQAGTFGSTIKFFSYGNACGGGFCITATDQTAASFDNGSTLADILIDGGGVHTRQIGSYVELDVSWFDTYTLNGPAALLGTQATVTPSFAASGTFTNHTATCSPGNYTSGDTFVWIGTYHPEATSEQFRVAPFGGFGNTSTGEQVLKGCPDSPVTLGFSANFPITVTYGTPFQVGYEFVAWSFWNATFDYSHTGVVSFSIPDGATLSSALADSAAPEPGSALLASAVVALVALRKRR